MSKLIDELKREHAVIVDGLAQLMNTVISSKEGQQLLLNVKQSLLAHLRKEDGQLYPVLNKAAEKDSALKQTLDHFARDMAEISETAIAFFDKYSGVGADIGFPADFGKLYAALKIRVHREEDVIYAKYARLNP